MEFTRDGGTVPSHIPVKRREWDEHSRQTQVKRGYVQRVVPATDDKNLTGQLEYVVAIDGQDYPGVLDVVGAGGIFNNHRRVRKAAEYAFESGVPVPILDDTYEEKKDGEAVLCLFFGADGDAPVIIGGLEHPLLRTKNLDYKDPDGLADRFEWNGLVFALDEEGNYTIEQIGKKEPITGAPTNPQAIGAKLSITKDGDFIYEGALGTTVKLTSAEDKIEAFTAFGDKAEISALNGIQLSTPAAGGTSVSMKAGMVDVQATVGVTVKSTAGSTTVEGVGGAKMKVGTAQVGLGGPAGELLAEVEKLAQAVIDDATAASTHVHPTAVGPSGPPTTAASFVAVVTAATAIKAIITALKGGI